MNGDKISSDPRLTIPEHLTALFIGAASRQGVDLKGLSYSIMVDAMADALAELARAPVPDVVRKAGRPYTFRQDLAWQVMLLAASQMGTRE